MKAPSFWYKPQVTTASILLSPLSVLFRMGGALRRLYATPYRAKVPVICIGNIVAGGAGKTPSALALADILKQAGKQPVFVTRGYGGSERGPLQVDLGQHTAVQVGDEALLLARLAPTFIGRDRIKVIKLAETKGSHIILDDGLQNPNIVPDLALLAIDGDSGLGNNRLIPAGPLRESLHNAMKRITAIILIGERDEQKIARLAKCPILRANWRPNLPPDFPKTQKFFAFAGIGRPAKFYDTCRKAGLTLVGTHDFSDHHVFSNSEMKELRQVALEQGAKLLTTEKDWVRMPQELCAEVTAFPVSLIFDDPALLTSLITKY